MRRADPTDPEPPRNPWGRRRRTRLLWTGGSTLVVLLLVGGWVAAAVFQSPAQLAASRKPPAPRTVTAPVEHGDLARTVSVRPVVRREQRYEVALGGGATRSVVTKTPVAIDAALTDGTLVAEVNGRPRFAIGGAFPFYRAMREGDTGPDVEQLQRALISAGYPLGADGTFGSGTARAITALYRDAGYRPCLDAGGCAGGEEHPPAEAGVHDRAPSAQNETKGSADPVPADSNPPRVIVPESEFVVFGFLPAVATSIPPVGTVLSESTTLVASAGPVVADATVDAATAIQLRSGMSAVVSGHAGEMAFATVASVTAQPVHGGLSATDAGSAGSSADRGPASADGSTASWTVRLGFEPQPPASWLGTEVRAVVTISVASAGALIVPTLAVVSGGQGHSYVLKAMPDGTFRRVPVEEVGQLAGRSAVAPVEADRLRAGDNVKVG